MINHNIVDKIIHALHNDIWTLKIGLDQKRLYIDSEVLKKDGIKLLREVFAKSMPSFCHIITERLIGHDTFLEDIKFQNPSLIEKWRNKFYDEEDIELLFSYIMQVWDEDVDNMLKSGGSLSSRACYDALGIRGHSMTDDLRFCIYRDKVYH